MNPLVTSLWIGLVSSAFGGLVGLGGGVIAVPLMHTFLKLTQHQASATALLVVMFTGVSGTLTYALNNQVDWLAAALLIPSAMVGARLGALLARRLPEARLKKVFGYYLVFVSVLLVLKPYIPHVSEPLQGWLQVVALVLAGLVAGTASGLLGVGGGTITVPVMVLLGGLEQHLAQGTSLMAMIPSAMVGTYTHYTHRTLVLSLIPGLVIGALVGAALGSGVANMLPAPVLRIVFAAVLIWTATRYLRPTARK